MTTSDAFLTDLIDLNGAGVPGRIHDDACLVCPDQGWRVLAARGRFQAGADVELLAGPENASERRFLADILPRPFSRNAAPTTPESRIVSGTASSPGDGRERAAARFCLCVRRDRKRKETRPVLIDRALYCATGLCLAVFPHLSLEAAAAVLRSGACGRVDFSPRAAELAGTARLTRTPLTA